MTDVFISWSGQQSQLLAEELRDWLPSVLQFAKPYYTPSDVEKGSKWNSEISSKLSECEVGIICLTRDNLEKPWILFEAGALSKNIESSRVSAILFGLDAADVSGPLAGFQNTRFAKKDFKTMLNMINNSGGIAKLLDTTLDSVFEKWWPDLESKVSEILAAEGSEVTADLRTERDILEEILELSRLSSKQKRRTELPIAQGAISDIEEVKATLELAATLIDGDEFGVDLHDAATKIDRVYTYLNRVSMKDTSGGFGQVLRHSNTRGAIRAHGEEKE